MLKILCIVNGELEENCYIVHNGKDALIIDPGSDGERIEGEINKHKLNVSGILVTHHHFDHIGALDYVKSIYKDAIFVDYKHKNVIKGFDYSIIENFGHTMDSVSFYFKNEKVMFTGDFVFKETIGNYDYFNEDKMIESLRKFTLLDRNITIYPGHGDKSTVGYEIDNNPYLRGF